MLRKVLRILGGLVGTGFIIVGVPAGLHYDGMIWPRWVNIVTMVSMGIVFIVFAISGRAWPSFYGQDVVEKRRSD